jgi:hypothetical protein
MSREEYGSPSALHDELRQVRSVDIDHLSASHDLAIEELEERATPGWWTYSCCRRTAGWGC